MNFSWRSLSANLATFVAPGLVLLLLAIQIAFGLRGFDRPDDSLLYVLEVPGVLLGWGGVALLLPLLAWMVLDWWGYDLNGFALKGLGSAVLGVAVGGLVGLSGGVPAGGIVGGGLATVLTETVGGAIAWILLILMALPACVLALSLQRTARPTAKTAAGKPAAPKSAAPKSAAPKSAAPKSASLKSASPKSASPKSASPKSATAKPSAGATGKSGGLLGLRRKPRAEDKAWYPQPRYDALGNELPMNFGKHRDVGGIRFADEGEAKEEETAVAPEVSATLEPPTDVIAGEERLPTIPELLAGNFDGSLPGVTASGPGRGDPSGGPREATDATPDDGPIHVDGRGRPISAPRPTAAAQAPEVVAPEVEARDPGQEVTKHVSGDAKPPGPLPTPLPFLRTTPLGTPTEERLLPGVRYVDEAPEDEQDPEEKAAEEAQTSAESQLSQAVRDAVRGPPQPSNDGVGAASARAIRKTLRQSVAGLQNEGLSDRHLAKLDALGMFDPVDPSRAAKPAPPKKAPPANEGGAAAATATKTRAPAKKPASGTSKRAAKKAAPKKGARKRTAAKPAVKKTATKKSASRGSRSESKVRPPQVPPAGPKAGRKGSGAQASARSAAADRAARDAAARRTSMIEGLRIERLDPLFRRSVEAALDRGAASPMLLTRRLGLPFARAIGLIERMVATGVLSEETQAGSHPLALTRAEWDQLG